MRALSSRSLVSVLLAVSLGAPGIVMAEIARIVPRHPGPVTAEWTIGGPGRAVAGKHPLAPTVRVDSGAPAMEIALPGAGTLRILPIGISSLGAERPRVRRGDAAIQGDMTPRRSLEAGRPILSILETPGPGRRETTLFVKGSWQGVDETFVLRSTSIKHDLLVSRDAVAALGEGDIVAEWLLELPPGVRAVPASEGRLRAVHFVDAKGAFLARIPAPLVRDADDARASADLARLELLPRAAAPVLRLVVSGAWAQDPGRSFPLALDPTVDLQPTDLDKTGFVDELGGKLTPEPVSGSLLTYGFGADVRGFAEFPLDTIPDGSNVTDVHLEVWLCNHDNPTDPAVPLPMWVKYCAVPASFPANVIFNAIGSLGTGRPYYSEMVDRTGPEWCPEWHVLKDYDLGSLADADVRAQLPADFITIGFTSDIVTDPVFDHIDYIGFLEEVGNPSCTDTDLPGSRITLVVEYEEPNQAPICDAGGPYVSDCPSTPILISAAASSDPDGDPLTFAWTSDCSGYIENPALADAILHLDPGCAEACTVTVAVSDATETVSCSASVTADDLTPPIVTSSDLDGLCLWPPRHDFYCIGDAAGHVVVTDTCGSAVVRWIGCLSDQPDEAREPGRPENGDGNTVDDCRVSADRTELCIRVERAGSDPVGGRNTFLGRFYGVAVEADDGCGNVIVVPGTVFVPHDRRGGSGGQLDPCLAGGRLE